MAQKLSEQVADLLQPFAKDCGDAYEKIVNDVSSFVGRMNITTKDGEWKAGSKLSLVAKDQHKMMLPPNAAQSHLLWFAVRLNEVAAAGDMVIEATVPANCRAWIDKVKGTILINTPVQS